MTAAVPWDLWPLLSLPALFVLAAWVRLRDTDQARQRRRHVMQRLARARNHDHGGQQ